MDLASVLGAVFGALMLAFAVTSVQGATPGAYWDNAALIIVVGGSMTAALICFPARQAFRITRAFRRVIFNHAPDFRGTAEKIVSLSETARRDGMLALEYRSMEITDPFMLRAVQMAVDGVKPTVLEDTLRTEMEVTSAHRRSDRNLFDQVGRFAPAFGMIGTLIGLIAMLNNLATPEKIGPGMAVALITTLYGAVVANVFCLPFAEKLNCLSKEELMEKEIIVRGILAIQAGDNPRVIEQRLKSFFPEEREGKKAKPGDPRPVYAEQPAKNILFSPAQKKAAASAGPAPSQSGILRKGDSPAKAAVPPPKTMQTVGAASGKSVGSRAAAIDRLLASRKAAQNASPLHAPHQSVAAPNATVKK